eukprot:TRINITY_DN7002_c0_g1_i1.p1 TRINITY_DN7002_c0_g1~~TRINITY_DN7002_c0_g1_i1.p1  ORF type:complete len:241 (+),score=30.05 TRINITY_DN7002_c0_g1_i1:114-836(+)
MEMDWTLFSGLVILSWFSINVHLNLYRICKPLPMAYLIFLLHQHLQKEVVDPNANKVFWSLIFGVAGDIVLTFSLKEVGVFCFLVGHVLYIAAFWRDWILPLPYFLIPAILMYSVILWILRLGIKHQVPRFLVAFVSCYLFFLSILVFTSLNHDFLHLQNLPPFLHSLFLSFSPPSASVSQLPLLTLESVLFFVSDSTLMRQEVREKKPTKIWVAFWDFVILTTYYYSQALFTLHCLIHL